MSLVMAALGGGPRLILAGDSKIRYYDEAGTLKTCTGSKITVFSTLPGNIVIGHAGMWIEGGADDLLQGVIGKWVAAKDPLDEFCKALAHHVAQRLTQLSMHTGAPNLSEFLVGWFPRDGEPELWFVSSGHSEAVPSDVVWTIGGDPTQPSLAQTHRPVEGQSVTPRFVVDDIDRAMSPMTSAVYDYPVLLVQVWGASPEDASREWFGPGGNRVSAPSVERHTPRPF